LITLLVFGLALLLPGGRLSQFASDPSMTAANLQQLKHYYGLDQPAPVRYVLWL
jgi:peptide/nickel transport system permease protein